MIRFLENYSLQPHNTFGIEAKAKYFFAFTELEDLDVFFQSNQTLQEENIYEFDEIICINTQTSKIKILKDEGKFPVNCISVINNFIKT